MRNILANIFNLFQHFSTLRSTPEQYCPSNCPHCYKNTLWRHGVYYRQAQCENQGQPIPIPRFFCPDCERTCSTLPEYIPPRRWYHWITQQVVLLLLMLGRSAEKACEELSCQWTMVPSIDTLSRWLRELRQWFPTHQFHLCSVHPELRFEPNCNAFWLRYFEEEGGLSSAMLALNRAGQIIP